MKERITSDTPHFTPTASLAAVGVKLQQIKLFAPIEQLVQITQKTVKYSPVAKLYSGFLTILAGAHGLVEINTRLRSDPVLQAACGCSGCADQSVVQETLNSCSSENVNQSAVKSLEAQKRKCSDLTSLKNR